MLNKIDCIRAALQGEPVDRVPASFWVHFRPEFRNGSAMAQAHLEFYRRTDMDFLKVMNDNPYCLVGVDRIDTPVEWRKLKPTSRKSKIYQEYLDGLKEILDAVGHETLVIVTVFNPFATANDNHTGNLDYSDAFFSTITEHLRQDPESTAQGLAVIAQSLAEFSQECIRAGAAGIFFSANGGERERFTPDEFNRYIKPSDLDVLQAAQQAGAEFNLLHICGAGQRLESYVDYPVQAVNWAPQMNNLSLAEGRKLFMQTILGGMDQHGAIRTGPREAVEQEVSQVLKEIGRESFILGAGCAVVGEVPTEHFVWAREAAASS